MLTRFATPCCCRCAALVRVLRQARAAPLLSMAVAEATAAVVCEPGSRTTEQSTLEMIVQVRLMQLCRASLVALASQARIE